MAAKQKKSKVQAQAQALALNLALSHSKPASELLIDVTIQDLTPEVIYKKGSQRPFLVTDPSQKSLRSKPLSSIEWSLLVVLLLVACRVRLFKLAEPASVVFDEVHFGGFAKKYLNREFFMDVHPPLAKLLFAAMAYLGGSDKSFDYATIATPYPSTIPHALMRTLPAVMGVATVILCYLTLRSSGVRPIVAAATSSLLILENANVTISRYILLDAPLLFFIALAVYCWKRFEYQTPFSKSWFGLLIATGVTLGLALSSKWVGLFTVAWVGLLCVFQMWFVVGDLLVSARKVWAHTFSRAFILLAVPFTIYLASFAIHFHQLDRDGPGGDFMSPSFRTSLEGNLVPKAVPAVVGLGSVVSIRHKNSRGGFLHSHEHSYPAGSKQQQVTLYGPRDSNNLWRIEPYNSPMPDNFTALRSGTKVRLVHINTGRRVHSHDEKPPVSQRDWQKEVSCYGFPGFAGDANDDFEMYVTDQDKDFGNSSDIIHALHSTIRFRHAMSGQWLFSTPSTKLPEWGFEQQEVTCAGQGADHYLDWYIEENTNEFLPESETNYTSYPQMNFLQKFVEVHKVMWEVNQGLTSFHDYQSEPVTWPLLQRGINYWVKDNRQVYLIGNPVVWWLVTLTVPLFALHVLISVMRWHLGSSIASDKAVFNFNVQAFSYLLGWALHYVPFFIMGRQLFIHHYIPSLYFGILAVGHFLEVLVGYLLRPTQGAGSSASSLVRKILGLGVIGLLVSSSAFFFYRTSPLAYGTPWTKSECLASKLSLKWDFACDNFQDKISEYAGGAIIAPKKEVVDGAKAAVEIPEGPAATSFNEAAQAARFSKAALDALLYSSLQSKKAVESSIESVRLASEEAKKSEAQLSAAWEAVKPPAYPGLEGAEPAAEAVKDAAEPVVESAKEAVKPAAESVKEAVKPAAESVKEAVKPAAESAKEAAKSAVESVKEAAKPVVESAKEAAKPVVESAKEAAKPVVESVQESAKPVVESAKEAAKPVVEAAKPVVEAAEPVVESAKEAAKPVVESAKEAAKPVVESAKEAAKPVVEAAKPVVESAKEAAKPVAESIKEAVKPAAEAAEPVVESAKEAAKPVVESAAEAAKPVVEAAKPVVESAKEAAKPVVESAKEAAKPVVEAAKPVVESAQEAAKPVVESAKEAAKPVAEPVKEAAKPVVESAKEAAKPVGA